MKAKAKPKAKKARAKEPEGTQVKKTKGVFEKIEGSNIWWIRFSDGTRYADGTSRIRYEKAGSKSTAEKLLALRKTEVLKNEKLPNDLVNLLVSELRDALTQDYKNNEQRSLKHLESRLKKHIIPFFGGMVANAIGTDDIGRYVAKRRKEGAANATINRELAALRRMYTLAYNSKPRRVNEILKITRLKESAPRDGFVEHSQYNILKSCADDLWFRAIIATAYVFAFRRGELLDMRVRQINLADRTIQLAAGSTKNDAPRTIVMTEEVFDLLSQCIAGKSKNDYVFTRGNEPVLDFRGAWEALCTKAGCEGLLFHDLRRSGVRNLVRAGVSERVAMTISGHKSRSVFDRYDIISQSDLVEAAAKLEKKRTESRTEVETQAESENSVVAE